MYMCVYIYNYIIVYVCIYIYIYIYMSSEKASPESRSKGWGADRAARRGHRQAARTTPYRELCYLYISLSLSMCIYIYIYTYVYIYIYISVYIIHPLPYYITWSTSFINMPFESSNLPGAGPIFPDRTCDNRP